MSNITWAWIAAVNAQFDHHILELSKQVQVYGQEVLHTGLKKKEYTAPLKLYMPGMIPFL